MKRSELKPGKPLQRTTGLRRGTSKRAVAPLKRSRGHRLNPISRRSLTARSGGRCEAIWPHGGRCRNAATDPHHRLTKKRAGKPIDALWNLLDFCSSCHGWTHANPHQASDRGWLLPSST